MGLFRKQKDTSIMITCPTCNNKTTMTTVQNYKINENSGDMFFLKNANDLVIPEMEKSLYDFFEKVSNGKNSDYFGTISLIGKHRVDGLFSKYCLVSDKFFKVFHYYSIDRENKTAGYTFRLIEEMLPASSFADYGKISFVSKNEELANQANELTDAGYYVDVIKIMNKELMINPESNTALYHKGLALLSLEYSKEAISCFDQMLKTQPDNESCLIGKGMALRYLEQYEESIACYDQILKLEPNHAQALSSKGVALRYLKKYDEAMICYDKSLELDPADFKTWTSKGTMLLVLNNLKDAIACFDEALKLKPNMQEIIKLRNEAVEELEKQHKN